MDIVGLFLQHSPLDFFYFFFKLDMCFIVTFIPKLPNADDMIMIQILAVDHLEVRTLTISAEITRFSCCWPHHRFSCCWLYCNQ